MESDCTILMHEMSSPRRPKGRRRIDGSFGVSRIVIFLVAISWTLPLTCSLFIDCDSINAAKKCECGLVDRYWQVECPKMPLNETSFIFPVSLKVQTEQKTGSAFLSVQCSVELPEFQWKVIEGIDLSFSKIGTNIEKVILEYCPMVDDGLDGFLGRINIPGEQLTKFTFLSKVWNISTIPPNFFSRMKNLEVVVLSRNELKEVPNLTSLTQLKDLNLRDNYLARITSESFAANKNLESLGLNFNRLEYVDFDAIPETIKKLDLSYNSKFLIPSKFLQRFRNLETLLLNGVNLGEVKADAFDDLPELKILYLNQGFGLQRAMTFKNLSSLKDLSMNDTRNTSPEASIHLEGLPLLEAFYMRSGGLRTLPGLKDVPKLTIINLTGNKISNLSVEFFEQAKSLTSLDLSNNQIHELVEIKAGTLKSLDLGGNKIEKLTAKAFRHLGRLEWLNLRNNQIKVVEFKAFESQGQLQMLDMSHNNIEFEISPFAKFTSATDIFGPDDISNYSPLHPCLNLSVLKLSHNPITMIYDDWRNSKIQLTDLDLSYNNISSISAVDLDFVARNITLNLSNNKISSMNIERYSFILHDKPSSVDVYLDGNPLHCDCEAYTIKSFTLPSHRLHFNKLVCASPKELENKALINIPDKSLVCSLENDSSCPGPCQCFIRPVDTTLVADCSNKGMVNEDLEMLSWNLAPQFSLWNAELNLSRNNITEYKTEYLSNIPNRTRRIDLSRNKLLSISFIRSLQDETKVSLVHNSFACDRCADFVLLWATFSQQIEDSGNVTCLKSSSNELERREEVQLQDIATLVDDCKPVLAGGMRLLIIIIGVLTVLCVLLIVIIFRYAWVIKAYLYSKGWGWCLFWDGDYDPEDEEKLYDAFVSYSHKDEEWVIEELVNRLEDKEGFKLCLHFRDWTPGDWIPDQIVKSVDQSKRTVVILSKNFVESVWSRLEFKAAHAQALSQRSNRVILVLLEDGLKEADVKDDDLRVYMKMNTYLKWNDPWFWHKLKYALPHRKRSDDQQDMIRKLEQRERAIQLDKLRAKLEQTV